jgi:hypothetical protein
LGVEELLDDSVTFPDMITDMVDGDEVRRLLLAEVPVGPFVGRARCGCLDRRLGGSGAPVRRSRAVWVHGPSPGWVRCSRSSVARGVGARTVA